MKKSILSTAIVFALACSIQTAQANNMPYEPIFEAAPISEAMTSSQATESSMTKIASAQTPTQEIADTVENANLQSAMMQLDSAQVEIRNQLVQYKSEYADLDNSYKMIKEQRAAKAKLVRATEKKIKNIESTKERIRKNMN